MINSTRCKHMTGKNADLAVLGIGWRAAAWAVANGVAFLAMAWVVVNEPTWLLVG